MAGWCPLATPSSVIMAKCDMCAGAHDMCRHGAENECVHDHQVCEHMCCMDQDSRDREVLVSVL